MAIQLRARGFVTNLERRTVGRVSFSPVDGAGRQDTFRIVKRGEAHERLDGYLAAIIEDINYEGAPTCPVVFGHEPIDFLKDDYIVAIEPVTGLIRVLYRPESGFNTIFITEDCNSHCLMCSQPPRKVDESGVLEQHLRHIDLIANSPEQLGITGGEPTLLGGGLIQILRRVMQRFPNMPLTMLSNGRMYAYGDFVQEISAVGNANFLTSIPLYASTATVHDFVVQAKGAFDQTIQGFYNAARYGLRVEVRVVLHKQTIPGLIDLVEFIYRNLPFVEHVALMGLENMGYVKKNWDALWIDPVDYAPALGEAARFLWIRQIPVSIYNLPLCVIPKNIWSFARKSISDYKNIFLDECEGCVVRAYCSGLFQSSERRHSRGIKKLNPLLG